MKICVFDLDGTLLDTLEDIGSACNTILAHNGYPQHPMAAYRQMVGNGFEVLIKRALPIDYMPESKKIENLVKEAREQYAMNMQIHTKPYPGMIEALDAICNQGNKCAVFSNKPNAMTTELITHYFPRINFVFIRGAKPDTPLKPNPEVLLALLKENNISSHNAIYIGDSNVDILTAKNANITSIGAAWGFRGKVELEEAGAKLIATEPSELPPIVSSL